MSPEELEKWRKAGRLSAECLDYGCSLIRKGAKVVDVLDKIEEKIAALGAQPSFPAQISLNHVAAHFCSDDDDATLLHDQVAKLDLGVSVDGFLGDNARTIDLSGSYSELVAASKEALDEAVKVAAPGIAVAEIGQSIQDVITAYGFAPVRNLSGHGLGCYEIHTKPTIPNFNNGDTTKLQPGQVIAIEPFATSGSGAIQEAGSAGVFAVAAQKPVRDNTARDILQLMEPNRGLPFARRWLTRKFGSLKTEMALKQLLQAKAVVQFPPLIEVSRGMVSQHEHTLLITENGNEVLTKTN